MDTIESTYEIGDWLIYPKHGLGKAVSFETQTILKKKVVFLVVFFQKTEWEFILKLKFLLRILRK